MKLITNQAEKIIWFPEDWNERDDKNLNPDTDDMYER